MIQNLDTVVVAEEAKSVDFSPLPAGTYTLRLLDVEDWKPTVLANLVLKPSGEKVTNVTVYNANLKFGVVGGDYDGRLIFDRLTTHPNIPWSISGFLHAMGVEAMAPSQIKTLIDGVVDATIKIASYEKIITDPTTGLEIPETKIKNEVTRYKKSSYYDDLQDSLDI